MNSKRKNANAIFYSPSESKRRRTYESGDDDEHESSNRTAQPKVDPTYGQRGAFPGLDEGEDEQLFYAPASDGLEYLRMVRSEAKSVPTLLVAPTSQDRADRRTDHESSNYEEGYYADGAYTATPAPPTYASTSPTSSNSHLDPQEAYHASLCSRFASHSANLRNPPSDIIAPPSIINTAQTLNSGSSNFRWRRTLSTKPCMRLLGQLSQEAVLQGLSALERKLSEENLQQRDNLGLWAWGLLGRCRDVGEMGSEEVGVLRDLGKKAIWVLRGVQAGVAEMDQADIDGESIRDEENEAEKPIEEGAGLENYPPSIEDATAGAQAQVETQDEPAQSGFSDSLEAAKARILATLPSESPSPKPDTTDQAAGVQTPSSLSLHGVAPASSEDAAAPALDGVDEQAIKLQATLNMIITVVGEFYGQRDLLPGRLSWDEDDGA
ncbi:MAG: hypothetical protein Q9191_001578 [Dirinaria sp. TL-2023a]